MKLSIIAFCLFILSIVTNKESGYQPKLGFVPDSATAIKIAETIWLPIYGDEIYKNKPFKATLKDSLIWVVEGSMPAPIIDPADSENVIIRLGGVPYIEICKSDCRILKVSHGK